MSVGRTAEQAKQDKADRDRHNLELRNGRRRARGLRPFTMKEFLGRQAGNGRTRVSNAWHRLAGRRIAGARTRVSNWRNRHAIARGRRDAPARAADAVRSRTPVVRDRVNRATGRQHRDDARLGRLSDESLARSQEPRSERRYMRMNERAPGPGEGLPRAYRARGAR